MNGEIIAEPTHQQHQYPHLHLTTPSNIRLIEHESSSSDYDYNHRQENYKRPKYKLAKPHKKSNYLKSLISGVEDAVENVSGWGWDKKQEVYQIKGAKFSLLDILLSGLSLVSFGAFLMNLLTNLLSVSTNNVKQLFIIDDVVFFVTFLVTRVWLFYNSYNSNRYLNIVTYF